MRVQFNIIKSLCLMRPLSYLSLTVLTFYGGLNNARHSMLQVLHNVGITVLKMNVAGSEWFAVASMVKQQLVHGAWCFGQDFTLDDGIGSHDDRLLA
jgi:hypothetical protein